jgi:hypothetical protein
MYFNETLSIRERDKHVRVLTKKHKSLTYILGVVQKELH